MHAQTNPLQRVYDCVRCACANSRTRHTKTRLEATLPFRTLEMQLQFSLHAGLFTSGGMLPSAKAHAYARPILLYALAITPVTTCTREAHGYSGIHGYHRGYHLLPRMHIQWYPQYCCIHGIQYPAIQVKGEYVHTGLCMRILGYASRCVPTCRCELP